MLLLLMFPVLVAVAAFQRHLAVYAPSNVLIRHVRHSPARFRTVVLLAALAAALLLAMRAVQLVIDGGGAGWLNVVALILAWDATKIGCLALVVALRSAARAHNWHPAGTVEHPEPTFVGSSRV